MQTTIQRRIEELLRERGSCSVDFLSSALGVSDMTVRRDLQRLADVGRVVRTHGGASPAEQVMFEFQFLRRAQQNARQKEQIAATAARLVRNGTSVLLDSGTTTLALARHLRARQSLTVITTSLPIAAALQHSAGVETVLLGGVLRRDAPDLGGPLTEANLEHLRADLAFVGADGLDSCGHAYNASLSVARMLAKLAACAAEVYVVADGSKLGRTALMRFGDVAKWRGLITDARAPAEQVHLLRQAGVNVMVAPDRNDSGTGDRDD